MDGTFSDQGHAQSGGTQTVHAKDDDVAVSPGDTQDGSTACPGITIDVNGIADALVTDGSGGSHIPHSSSDHPLSAADVPDAARDSLQSVPVPHDETAEVATCFAAGTMIATPAGEVAVEALAIGDLVTLEDGRDVPVRWLAIQTLKPILCLPERNRIVEIAPGALGDGLPHSTLRLTAGHALLLDGVLVHAGALVGATGIRVMRDDELGQGFTTYHVETETQEILLANGAASESFVTNVSRRAFENFAEYTALYGPETDIAPAPYPRATGMRQVSARLGAQTEAA
ncbi:Hint domain-containing protein [Mesobacterium pallidum]|uniref:Hint domain-containing protein n=1 Tax=Mesobacterium pallidum TaxID=2872037 RepID=UPI001EE2AA26|nr:Hint domain-containing protein [Mesobacterium pallidum]